MSCPLTYIRPHPGLFGLLEFVRSLLHSEEVLQAIEEHINHILRFNISFVSESARLALVRVRVQGVVALCADS
jgi:hypothetical protein